MILELRRHTMRTKPGQHLSQAGVTRARHVGEKMGYFDRVITSTIPRAFETAIAMGFAVHEQYDLLSEMSLEVNLELNLAADIGDFAQVVRQGNTAAKFAAELAHLHRTIASTLPETGRALIISHGGIVELTAIGCLPEADYTSFGVGCDYCEGIQLTFAQGHFTQVKMLRLGNAA